MAEQQKRLKSLAACVDQTRRQAKQRWLLRIRGSSQILVKNESPSSPTHHMRKKRMEGKLLARCLLSVLAYFLEWRKDFQPFADECIDKLPLRFTSTME